MESLGNTSPRDPLAKGSNSLFLGRLNTERLQPMARIESERLAEDLRPINLSMGWNASPPHYRQTLKLLQITNLQASHASLIYHSFLFSPVYYHLVQLFLATYWPPGKFRPLGVVTVSY
jgi:hypothetical protein